MRKSPPLILLVFILTISLVTPSYAGVNDNVLNSSLEQSIGTYEDPVTAKTVFGMLQHIVAMLTSISTQVADVQSMRNDIADMKDSINYQTNISELQSQMAISSTLQNYLDSGVADLESWNASDIEKKSIATSTQMINSKYSHLALDYCINHNYIDTYLQLLQGYSGSVVQSIDQLTTIPVLRAIVATDWGKYGMGAKSLCSAVKSAYNSGKYTGSVTERYLSSGYVMEFSNIFVLYVYSSQWQSEEDSGYRWKHRGLCNYITSDNTSGCFYGSTSSSSYGVPADIAVTLTPFVFARSVTWRRTQQETPIIRFLDLN